MSNHVLNVFPVDFGARTTVCVRPFQVRALDDGLVSLPRLGDVAFALGRALRTSAQVHKGAVWILEAPDAAQERTLPAKGREFQLTAEPATVWPLQTRSSQSLLRRLAAQELKMDLVYKRQRHWHRAGAFYEHQLRPLRQGFYSQGMRVRFVITGVDTIAVALDPTLCPVGPDLQRARGRYRDNPYEQGAGPQRRRRSYLYRHPQTQHIQRVWLRSQANELRLRVALLRDAEAAESVEVSAADVFPILAPWELEGVLGWEWRERQQGAPAQRQQEVQRFLTAHLADFPCLGGQARLSATPLPLRGARLSWPALSAGPQGVRVGAPALAVEHRAGALRAKGPRCAATVAGIEIVGLARQPSETEGLLRACRALLKEWRMEALAVSACPLALPSGRDPQELEAIATHYSQRGASRPLLLVFDGHPYRKGQRADPFYVAAHQRLGGDLDLPMKMVQPKGDRWHDAIENVLASALARAGTLLWGLHPGEARTALHHELCIGVDIGGRDRSGSRGNDRLLAVALTGDDPPRLWTLRDAPTLTTETLEPQHLRQILRGAATARQRPAGRDWLYLRDGTLPDEERAALIDLAAELRSDGLLAKHARLVTVEVRKDHGLRIYRPDEAGIWQQPAVGATWIRRGEFVLATTGDPWNTRGTADPLRCRVALLSGPEEGFSFNAVVRDVYRMTHLNYSAPHHECRLPLPLHCAQRLGEDLENGIPISAFPF